MMSANIDDDDDEIKPQSHMGPGPTRITSGMIWCVNRVAAV